MTVIFKKKSKLKVCPFCGGPAELKSWEEDGPVMSARVECANGCGAQSGTWHANNKLGCMDAVNGKHTKKAIENWNTRLGQLPVAINVMVTAKGMR